MQIGVIFENPQRDPRIPKQTVVVQVPSEDSEVWAFKMAIQLATGIPSMLIKIIDHDRRGLNDPSTKISAAIRSDMRYEDGLPTELIRIPVKISNKSAKMAIKMIAAGEALSWLEEGNNNELMRQLAEMAYSEKNIKGGPSPPFSTPDMNWARSVSSVGTTSSYPTTSFSLGTSPTSAYPTSLGTFSAYRPGSPPPRTYIDPITLTSASAYSIGSNGSRSSNSSMRFSPPSSASYYMVPPPVVTFGTGATQPVPPASFL